MKKILFVAAAALVSTGAFAQSFEKGDIFVKASVSELDLGFWDYDGTSQTEIKGNVGGGYFFTDKLAADVELGGSFEKVEKQDATKALEFQVGVRYNVWTNLYARAAFVGQKETGMVNKKGDSAFATCGQLEVGYDYFISEKVYIEPALYYRMGFGDVAEDISKFGLKIGGGIRF